MCADDTHQSFSMKTLRCKAHVYASSTNESTLSTDTRNAIHNEDRNAPTHCNDIRKVIFAQATDDLLV